MRRGPPEGGGGGDDWFEGAEGWEDLDTAERDAVRRAQADEHLEQSRRSRWRRRREPSGDELRAALGVEEGESSDTGERRRLRDDPFTPAKVPVPGERRSRRRDMPAKVRRRQATAIGVAAALLLIGIVVLASGGGDEAEPLPLKKLVGQTVVAVVGKAGPDDRLLRRVRKGRIGGVIVKPRNEATLAGDVERLQKAAEQGDNPPLLVMIDQEGGKVRRLPGPPKASPAELGEAGDAEASRRQGEATGAYLSELGVNVDLAPVLDVALPRTARSLATRTFGEDPAVVAEVGTAFAEGLQAGGVAATAKHFPGLGPATINTDDAPVTIAAAAEDLDTALGPFRAAADADIDLVMVATASYPAYGSDQPAVASPQIVQGLLREELGYDGLVITDDLEADSIAEDRDPRKVAVRALAAGVDLLLFARSDRGSSRALDAVTRAAKAEVLDRAVLEDAYDRITKFKRGI